MKESKICASCGRTIEWRKKWQNNWDEIRYCSDACRKRKTNALDTQIEKSIEELLDQRAHDASICPSEVARALGGEEWRDLMEPTRRAARRLVDRGLVQITQQGSIIDPSAAKGPIRIRRPR